MGSEYNSPLKPTAGRMKNGVSIGASLAGANYRNLEKDIRELEQAGVDTIHFDVMDGHFVPNFALNPEILRMTRELTALPIDVHLMVANPEAYIPIFAKEGCNIITFHQEATPHSQRELTRIRGLGLKTVCMFKPRTSTTQRQLSQQKLLLLASYLTLLDWLGHR